jgi:8-oxo-dGTP diphosphatase
MSNINPINLNSHDHEYSLMTQATRLIQRSHLLKALVLLIPLVILYVIISHPFDISEASALSDPPCPYVWHGGSPSHRGSCWCGAEDHYCMCTPSLAIDAIIELHERDETMAGNCDSCSILLVYRGDPPRGLYAIPGGFVNVGESVESAVTREAHEETNLTVLRMEQFKMFSNPGRDKRRHTASMVFRCIVRSVDGLRGGDDAKSVQLVPLKDVLSMPLAFDHKTILTEYIQRFHPSILAIDH